MNGMSQTQVFMIVFAVVFNMGCIKAVEDPQQLRISTKHDNDKVDVRFKHGKAVVSIHSPLGISQAIAERLGEKWADAVVLRLHLNGLEHFKATNGKVTLECAVSNDRVRLWKNGNEASLLDRSSPYWMEIRMVGNDGEPKTGIPLNDGYFEMHLSQAFFEGNPKSITISWIDFYRN